MNPNSQHQLWSRWLITVVVPGDHARSRGHDDPRFFNAVKLAFAREARRLFGGAGQGHVTRVWNADSDEAWEFQVRAEGFPAHEPGARASRTRELEAFFGRGFGAKARVIVAAAVEAGDVQDGKPAAQLLILPPVNLLAHESLVERH